MTTAPKLDANFIKTFAAAALETLRVQCSFEARVGKPFIKGQGEEVESAIAGIIGLTSNVFKGTIAIAFPEKTFLAIMGGMLGESFEVMTPDLEDGAAELMNIVFGCAKKSLSEKGFTVERAVPTVVKGKNVEIRHISTAPILIIPFESPAGGLQIEIVLE